MINRDEDRAHARLSRIPIDEPVDVWVSTWSAEDLAATLEACAALPREGNLALVVWLPPQLSRDRAERALAYAGRIAATLTLVAGDAERLAWGALAEGDIRAAASTERPVPVLVEPDPRRAVVGSMQLLRRGDALCVLWSAARGSLELDHLVALGAAWRAAWDAPDVGEFFDNPRGCNDLGPAVGTPTEEPPTQGDTR